MRRIVEESKTANLQEQRALLAILDIKANMSLTSSQEKEQIDQFMKSFNRTDRIRLNALLQQTLLKQRRKTRSVQMQKSLPHQSFLDEEKSDEIFEDCESLILCKLRCNLEDECNVIFLNLNVTRGVEFIDVSGNCTNEGNQIVAVSLI